MNYRILATTAMAATLLVGQAGRASADIGEVIVGGIIGGVVAGAINESRNGSRVRTRTVVVDSAARQLVRDIQRALNYFHWNVGAADGVMGRNSRAGIRAYQGYLGFGVTGELSDIQRNILLTAHQRAELGGAQVTQVTTQHRDGIRGILELVRDEALGVQPVAVAQPQPAAPTAQPPQETAVAGVPNLFANQGGATAQASLASHCNRVALVTSANGGYTDLQSMSDPVFALNEQFCLARGYAIAEGETLVAQIAGATPQTIAQQCAGLEPHLQSHVAALSLQPRAAVLAGVTQFVLNSGMSATDLAGTARICLSSGYQTDNLTVAIGSALTLVALGETAYGELPAHHLMQGIGASQRRDLAAEWYNTSLTNDPAATTEVAFRPGPEDRNVLIQTAVNMAISGAAAPQATQLTLPMPSAPQPAAPAPNK